MSRPLPTQMINRWQNRHEPGPDQGTIYWHILLGDKPEARDLAETVQKRLSNFPGLHLTPPRWLHVTTLMVGSTDEITGKQRQEMLDTASGLLAELPPIEVTLSRILYHPEAISLAVHPTDRLNKIRKAVQTTTVKVTGREGHTEGPSYWIPHMTLAYSEAEQPAEPLISALGRELPTREITVDAVSLVLQRGPERIWDWHPLGRIPLFGQHRAPQDT
ncbi:2'-5' RNA ligase family protein [Actinomadura decatromicini]|uniref:2'-5' RNA ligase family protein n=1 Tax=Actinomadura decatromicini TaxID=2604572 RepID=A0A5D3FYC4_9ACTN|nr:2'-5' RNA ligase family protein [Actinomadura decatromicini]TYK53022.1 2'-5' RNA ligase family protein [Actinomadura decatromicini]